MICHQRYTFADEHAPKDMPVIFDIGLPEMQHNGGKAFLKVNDSDVIAMAPEEFAEGTSGYWAMRCALRLAERLERAESELSELRPANALADLREIGPEALNPDGSQVRQMVEIVADQCIPDHREVGVKISGPLMLKHNRVVELFTDLVMTYHRAHQKKQATVDELTTALQLADNETREARAQHMAWYQRAEAMQISVAPVVDLYLDEANERARILARRGTPPRGWNSGNHDVLYGALGHLKDTVDAIGELPSPSYESFVRDNRQRMIFHASKGVAATVRAEAFLHTAISAFYTVHPTYPGQKILEAALAIRADHEQARDAKRALGRVAVATMVLAEGEGVMVAEAEIAAFAEIQHEKIRKGSETA